jgi:hypothetical protein
MTRQLELGYNDRERDHRAARRLREELRLVVDVEGAKSVASDLDKGATALLQELADSQRHHLKLADMIAIMRRDRHGEALAVLCDELGYERPTKKRVLEPGEKLERLEAALDQVLGTEAAELVRRRAGVVDAPVALRRVR